MSVNEQLPDTSAPAPSGSDAPKDGGRLWRSLWRTHFYAGIFSMPVLIMLAVTGLGILYTDTVNHWQFGELYRASSAAQRVSLDDQRQNVADQYPTWTIGSVTPARRPGDTTVFAVSKDDGAKALNVYTDPSDGTVVGDLDPGAGLVGLSNRLHGQLNTSSWTVPVPMLSGIFGDEDLTVPVAVGDLVVEVFAVWSVVLALTGLYLWWPRKKGTGKALFVPRLGKKGRARWRDLHAVPGLVLSVMLVFFVTTGMPWSDVWGANWSWTASKITPNTSDFWSDEAPTSDVPKVGDLDRVGNRVPWATREDQIPTSGTGPSMPGMDMGGAPATEQPGLPLGTTPPQASLQLVVQAALEDGMLPGATVAFPVNDFSKPSEPVFGAYVVTNPWPSSLGEQGALYQDQFTARTISRSTSKEWGGLQRATELGVQTHMGTQFGLADRIVMTLGCVLVLWASFSALVMWWKRRRTGFGFPRRPFDAKLQRVMVVTAVLLAIIYPVWGVSVLLVLLLDKFVVRKVPPLRRAFGMPDRTEVTTGS